MRRAIIAHIPYIYLGRELQKAYPNKNLSFMYKIFFFIKIINQSFINHTEK